MQKILYRLFLPRDLISVKFISNKPQLIKFGFELLCANDILNIYGMSLFKS